MNKPTIAVDADDTIFDENTAVRLFINKTYGYEHTEADYLAKGDFGRYWDSIWGVSQEEMDAMYEAFVTSPDKENMQPIQGAIDVLSKLKEKYNLVIVTSRDARAVEFTHRSLEEHYPEVFSDVHFVPLWGDGENVTKAKICNDIGAMYLIDDSLEHCELAADAGVKAILFGNYGWNNHQDLPKNVVRCKDWDAVGRILV